MDRTLTYLYLLAAQQERLSKRQGLHHPEGVAIQIGDQYLVGHASRGIRSLEAALLSKGRDLKLSDASAVVFVTEPTQEGYASPVDRGSLHLLSTHLKPEVANGQLMVLPVKDRQPSPANTQ